MKMMKTSPIEMTAESFGNRTLIVATKIEMTVNRNHWIEKPFFALKQRRAKGMLAIYTPSRYN